MHQPHQPVHPLQQPHSHLHPLNHQQQPPPPPQHHPYLHPPPPPSSLQQSQSLSAQQSASMHLPPSLHPPPPLQSQQQHHHQLQQLPHSQQHHHLSHLNHPHSNQPLQHLSGQAQSSHGISQQRQQQPQHHQHQSQAQQQHQIPPHPTHHHMSHPSALMNHSQYPNLMYAQMGSHGYVPSTGHVPSAFGHSSSASHRSETVGGASQQTQQSTQQSGSINSSTAPHMGQLPPSSNQTPGAPGVHQAPGSVMDTHMQSRLPLNQPYMMTNPYMHNAFYNQASGGGATSGGYYGYDQGYSQVPTDPYAHSANNTSHWPSTAPPSSMMSSSSVPGGTTMQPQLRPTTGSSVASQPATSTLPPPSRPPLASRTPERSPAPSIASSYPSPNHQNSSKAAGSNSLAQLEQMVMPNAGQPANPLKSPNHRSTTSSPNTNSLQPPQSMQYSYNSGAQGSYFSPTAQTNQSSYYPSYEGSDSLDQAKSSWSDQASNSVMIPPTAGSSLESSVGPYGQPQSYDGPSTYGDYTQLSTPSQSRFTTSSDMPTDPTQTDKSDPYAIDSQTFDDHDELAASSKTKKSRAKKGDDPSKKEKRQRAPRGAKAAAAAAAAAAATASASAAGSAASATPTPVQSAQSPSISSSVCTAANKVPVTPIPPAPEGLTNSTEMIDHNSLPIKQIPAPLPSDEAPDKSSSYVNQDLQPLMPRPRTSSQSSKEPIVQSTKYQPESPAQHSTKDSPNVGPSQPSQYPYGPDGYAFNHDSRPGQGGYYPPYETTGDTSQQPTSENSWSTQPVPPAAPVHQSGALPTPGATTPYNSEYNEPMNYNQYTQLSVPTQSKPEAGSAELKQASQVEQTSAESRSVAEPDQATPAGKPKRSRAKKSEDSSKRERKQRASKAVKNSAPVAQSISPSGDSTVQNDSASGVTESRIECSESDPNKLETPADPDETLAPNDKSGDPKPKKSRPKRDRKSRSAAKVVNQQNDESTLPPVTSDQLDTVSSVNNESQQEDALATAPEEATPVKPKRIRIRDSSSKSKKKLPKFALKFAKTKKRKRLGSSDNEQSDLDKTPPPSPDEAESGVQKRRSARNTKKLKYNDDDIGLGFSDSDEEDQPPPRKKSSAKTSAETGEPAVESVAADEPAAVASLAEDTMVVEKIMASRTGTRELEPEPGEVLPPDGMFIDVEEFYVKYKNISYLHCDWRTLEELERGDRRVAQKIKRFKQKKDNSNVFNFMDDDIFDPQYCEVDRILAVQEFEELVPDSEDETDTKNDVLEAPPLQDNIQDAKPNGDSSLDASTSKDQSSDSAVKMDVDSDETPNVEDTQNSSQIAAKDQVEETDTAEQSSNTKVDATKSNIEDKDSDAVFQDSSTTTAIELANDELTKPETKQMKKKISRHYLVKWRSLSYEDSTWELEEHIDPEKIKQFERFKDTPPKSKWRPVKRPKPEEWVRKEVSPVYKNNNTLREYQLEGINWLSFCWHQGRNCILADEMGLGKTIQSIAFINEIYQKGIHGPFLIIVPLSTVGNWAREFETWTDLNVITYHGSSTSRDMIREYEMFYRTEQKNRITSIYKFQVMITTFEIVLSDCLELREIPWRCCIIDEAHRLKNRNCKLLEGLRLLNMEHRVLLTGTPLQNNVEELFSLLNFLEPTQFSSTEQFLLEFGDLKTESQVDKLKLILKPMMLRRLKEDVEKTLAPKEETIVEVELTNIQKKYYRAILERNFSFLQKGSTNNNMPNLMNTMMELRKCCIHPYLINGAEEQILYEARQAKLAGGEPLSSHQAMVNASGKLVLIDKLLPRLKADGHRVLIFSQMVRCLDILEDYVTNKHYPYERIDGRVRGSDRQQAIDRYSKPGSDRFVFLLCTRAGGLGINLTAADTVIIFDSDWNPQNDLQAQARCHRIGQSKAVKIYRLICRNTYEREMFDKASLKLGLDKAVLQSMNTQKATGCDGQLTKKEIEELLRKGAYGALMDDDNAGDKFCEEDIDQILQRRTQVITIESAEAKGSTFSKATFSSSNNREDIELDDPNFWEKWAKKANIETEELSKDELIQLAPRRRTQTKRYGADGTLIEMSDLESSEEDEETISMRTRGSRRGQSKPTPSSTSKRGKRNRPSDYDDDEFMANIDGGYWSKSDCLKIENGLLTHGWGRWDEIVQSNHFKREINADDCENISRVILLYCLNSYKGDEKIKSFIWDLIVPIEEASKSESETNGIVATRGRKPKFAPPVSKKSVAEEIMDANWPKDAKNDPLIALPDDQYRRHLQRNCNRLLIRVKFLHYLKNEILKDYQTKIFEPDCTVNSVDIPPFPVDGDLPASWWDDEADKSLLIGVFKHGHDRFNKMRQDPNLCFLQRCGPPSAAELNAELNIRSACLNEDNRVSSSLRKTAAGACLDDVVNSVVREIADITDVKDHSQDVVDENKNSILKCNETSDSLDNLCENGVEGSSQTARMDITDDDSLMNESSEDMAMSDSIVVNQVAPSVVTDENGLLAFPSPNDLNQRFRRLITAHQRNSKKLELELAQRARDELKKERNSKFEAARNEREERKRSQAQKWSRREESDFAKAISFFGVEFDPKLNAHDWSKFRSIGKLDKKLDETLEDYFNGFVVMCKKVTSRPLTEEEEKCTVTVEPIAEDRASKCLSRIEYFAKIRDEIINHPELDERMKLCQPQNDLPDWWQNGTHDKELLRAVAKHGLYRLDYNMAYDPDLCFDFIIREKVEQLFSNPPASILIPLEQLQQLLDRNGIEYSRDIDLDNESEAIDEVMNSLLDTIENEDGIVGRSTKTTRSSSGAARSSGVARRGANTAVRSVDASGCGNTLRLSSNGDGRGADRRVAEVTPVLPDKIPTDLRKTHEAGEVTITIVSESVLLKLDDRPSMVLLGANNPIHVKIRWPRDKAIQSRIDNLILMVEKNEWPLSSKPSVPTITLPSHLAVPSPAATPTAAPNSSPSKGDKLDQPPMSPGSDISSISSKANRSEIKERNTDVAPPVTRGRRGKGRRPKQQLEVEPQMPLDAEPPRESTAKLRNLLSQGTSSPKTSTPNEKSSSKGDKQGSNLSSLLASYKEKKEERPTSSRSREDKKSTPNTAPLNTAPPNTGNLLPQILASMKPEYRDLLANPEAASLLMNSFANLTGNNFGFNLQTPSTSGASSQMSFENLLNPTPPRSSSKSHRGERSGSRHGSADKQNPGNVGSLLPSFKQPRSSSSSRNREEKDLPNPNLAGATNILPQILANMEPKFRDILANPEAASLLMSSLGGLTGSTNLNSNLRGSEHQSILDSLLQSGKPSSSKGPPPAHQRGPDGSETSPSGRELRRNSQGNRESSTSRSTRGKNVSAPVEDHEQARPVESSSRHSSSRRRGRLDSSKIADTPSGPALGTDILDLSSLPLPRKGSSLLRSETRTRRSRDQPEEEVPAGPRASGSSSKSSNKRQHDDMEPQSSEQMEQDQSGEKRTTRASKRIGSRIDALALNLQAKRQPRSDSPDLSPTLTKEKSRDNQMAAHGSASKSSGDQRSHNSKAPPPAAHSSSHKPNASTPTTEHQRDRHHREKDRQSLPSTQSSNHNVQSQPSTNLPSFANMSQEQLAQLISKVTPTMSTAAPNLSTQAPSAPQQARQDPLAALMSNPAALLAGLNPTALGGAGDIMNQLLRKAGTNDIVKNILNEFVKNPSLALDPSILATLTASLPMGSQSMPSFNMPTSAATSLPYGNFANPLTNPYLSFGMANLGMNNPLANPLGLFPNLYMPTRFPQQDQQQHHQQQQQLHQQQQQQQQQHHQHRQPNQSGASDGSSKDKKMRYSRK